MYNKKKTAGQGRRAGSPEKGRFNKPTRHKSEYGKMREEESGKNVMGDDSSESREHSYRGKRPSSSTGKNDRSRFGRGSSHNVNDNARVSHSENRDADRKGGNDRRREDVSGRANDRRRSENTPKRFVKNSDTDASQSNRKIFNHSTSDKRRGRVKAFDKKDKNSRQHTAADDGLTRLNKYIANAGVCSRREADRLIQAGAVSVNGVVVTEMGHKVSVTDIVHYGDEKLKRENLKYVLLNKPKGYITTTDDPFERKTVMNLVANSCKERIFPVGRLDRNTTGVLLFTNDGDLAKKLTHPKHNIKKLYHVYLDKPLIKNHMTEIANGIELDDGPISIDAIAYVENDKKQIGVEIHSGRNRIVRRIFEKLGYDVVKLDRVIFAGLTKKDVQRGKWRVLKDKEVQILKMLS